MTRLPDRRTRTQVLAHARWDAMIGHSSLDTVPLQQLRALDRFLDHCDRQAFGSVWDIRPEDFLSYDAQNTSAGALKLLKQAMTTVFPGHPALAALIEASRRKAASYLSERAGPTTPQPRTLAKSVREDQLPASWRAAISDMRAGFDRAGVAPPASRMIQTHVMKLRQLVCEARRAGLPDELSVDTVRAYAMALRSRNLAAATERASYSALLKMARYFDADEQTLDLLKELCRIYETKANVAPKQKFAKLHKTGYSPVALIDRAREILESATAVSSPRDQRALRNRACAIALFTVLPLRLADTRLTFGETISWETDHYVLDTRLSKSGYPYMADIDRRISPIIDALILHGTDPIWLDDLRDRCHHQKRPLFINPQGKQVGYNYVSDCWRAEFGAGEHLARTILHTFLEIELGEAGSDMARSATGQRAAASSRAYQADVLPMAQRIKAQTEISQIAGDGVDQGMFDLI